MTKEEAINRVQGYLTDYLPLEDSDELEEIIQALKPEHVLDKIRAEIEKLGYLNIEDGSDGYDKYIEQDEVLQIIDKYRTEMEREEEREREER
jgi:hypothetical protein